MDCPEHSGVSVDCPQIRIVGQEGSKSSPKKGSSNSEENGAEDDVSSADIEHLQFEFEDDTKAKVNVPEEYSDCTV